MSLLSAGGWNYRVMRYKDGALGIHEVYYDGAERPHSCTENPIGAVGDDLDDLRAVLERMLVSLEVDVLDYETIAATPRQGVAQEEK